MADVRAARDAAFAPLCQTPAPPPRRRRTTAAPPLHNRRCTAAAAQPLRRTAAGLQPRRCGIAVPPSQTYSQ